MYVAKETPVPKRRSIFSIKNNMKHIDTEEEINCHGCPNTHVNTPAGVSFELLYEETHGHKPHRNYQAPHFSSKAVRIQFYEFEKSLSNNASKASTGTG